VRHDLIIGLIILAAALAVGVAGILSNENGGHALVHPLGSIIT